MRLLASLACFVGLVGWSSAQGWVAPYEKGLAFVRSNNWQEARAAFLKAKSQKGGDESGPTYLPGPITERRTWRNGAPYSPNFGAAYAGFRQAQSGLSDSEKTSLLKTVGQELIGLLQKNQRAPATINLVTLVYTSLDDADGLTAVRTLLAAKPANGWKIDAEVMPPEANAGTNPGQGNQPPPPKQGVPPKQGGNTAQNVVPTATAPGNEIISSATQTGLVPYVANKYAILIGNSTSRLPDGSLAFAENDAVRMRTVLTASAGYNPANVVLIQNGTAEQIRSAAAALAARMPDGATAFIFYSGVGVNLGGKDYLAGIDADLPSNTALMLGKIDLYKIFMAKGCRIFAFFQANRTVVDGHYFGSEVPDVGSIAQMQATIPGDMVYSAVKNGKETGQFANAIVSVLSEYRTNQIPIFEFGWEVFNKMRRGDTGTTGGGSRQTPTLPVLSNLAADARF
jgi:Caspase domain